MGLNQLFFLFILHLHLISPCLAESRPCPPNQRDSLLEFSHSFVLHRGVWDTSFHSPPCDGLDSVASYPKTAYWNLTMDCCGWPGVTCDESTGDVIGLDLSCSWLKGILHPNTTLFRLPHLQRLDLSGNNFLGSTIPLGISVLEELTHLNLSWGDLSGRVPSELTRLNKLTSLDLSNNFNFHASWPGLWIEGSSLEWIAQNLSALRFVDLSWVDMHDTEASPSMNLSSHMIYLTAKYCSLWGEFPKNIFHLPNLRHLDLSENSFIGSLPKSNWTTPLVFLDLSNSGISERSLDPVHQLKNLKALHLDNFGLTGVLPSWLGNQTVTSLRLSGNSLIGHIPRSLANLNQLIALDLSRNQLSGKVDLGLFSGMRDLQVLGLTVDSLDYESSNYSFPKLEELYLLSGNLTRFPYFIRSLDRLRRLDLSGNKISGGVPSWFWNVSRDTLQVLKLGYNHIEGSFQFPWPNLISIQLQNNLLQGPLVVPPPSVMNFDVSSNSFTGTIDNSFCRLPYLFELNLAHNDLFGTLPSCLGNFTKFDIIDLSDNNFHGEVPCYLANLTGLSYLNLSHNSLEDTFPSWLGESAVISLDLRANKFHGSISLPAAGIPIVDLDYLDISDNNFEGLWPTEFLQQPSVVDLSDNHFHGPFPLMSPYLLYISVSNNKFGGEIPSSICSIPNLRFLDLSNNSLTGTLPPCLTNSSTIMSVLNLRMNKIGGIIPEILSGANGLRTLDLSQNRFEGTLPRSLASCKQLEVLNLSNNLIKDTFPYWLGTLPELQVLILRSNKFHGILNSSHGLNPFSKLRILDLSENDFSGLLPGSYFAKLKSMMTGRETMSYLESSEGGIPYRISVTVWMKDLEVELEILSVFTSIDLSGNGFWGPVPSEFGKLKSLKGLNLSHNSLTGGIPNSLGDLISLEWLDLSVNKLDGEIPQHLADITSLAVLNLSANQLTGQISWTGRFPNIWQI